MGTDLSKHLDTDLATGLDTSLAPSDTDAPLSLSAIAWWDPTRGITTETGVSAWLDVIGSVSALQSTTSNQLELVTTSAFTGHQMLARTTGAKWLNVTDAGILAIAGSNHTVYCEHVFTQSAVSSTGVVWEDTADPTNIRSRLSMSSSGGGVLVYQHRDGANNDVAIGGSALITSAASWAYGEADGSTVTLDAFSTTAGTDTESASPTTHDAFTIGALNAGTDPLQGELGNLVIFDRALTPAEHAEMQAWIEAKWV